MRDRTARAPRRTRTAQIGSPSAVLCQGVKPKSNIGSPEWDLAKKQQQAREAMYKETV